MGDRLPRPGEKVAPAGTLDPFVWEWMHDLPECCLWAVIDLDRPLPSDLVAAALERLIMLVPVLSARPRWRFWRGGWFFSDPGDCSRLVERVAAGSEREWESLHRRLAEWQLDPGGEGPLVRAVCVDGPERQRLLLIVHHVCADGDGTGRVVEQFAACCRELVRDPAWRPSRSLPACRAVGQMFRHLPWHAWLQAPLAYYGWLLREVWNTLRGRVRCPPAHDRPVPIGRLRPGRPRLATVTIEPDELASLRAGRDPPGATINDLLMAAWMRAVQTFNRERGVNHRWLRTAWTANMRRWWGEPVGTFANLSFIRDLKLPAEDLAGRERSIAAVRREIGREKRLMGRRELWAFVLMGPEPVAKWRWSFRAIRGWFMRMAQQLNAVTNIGLLDPACGDFGVARAIACSLVAPVFSGPALLVTATEFAGRLTLHLTYDGEAYDDATIDGLTGRLREELLG